MKNLFEHLKENMSILEGFRNLKAYCPDPAGGTAPTICQEWPTKDPYNSDAEEGFDIRDTDWLFGEIGSGSGNIAEIVWCDDNIYGSVSKATNVNQLKKEFIKAAEEWVKDNQTYFDDDDYVEMYIELPCGLCYDCAWDKGEDGKETPTGEQLWNKWMAQFNNSEVDGDSSYARSLVDLKTKKVIAGQHVIVDL